MQSRRSGEARRRDPSDTVPPRQLMAVALRPPSCIRHLPSFIGPDGERVFEELYVSENARTGRFELDIPSLGMANEFDTLADAVSCRDALVSDDAEEATKIAAHRARQRGERRGWKPLIDICVAHQVPGFDGVGFDGLVPYHVCAEHIAWDSKRSVWKLQMEGARNFEEGIFVVHFEFWDIFAGMLLRDRIRGFTDAAQAVYGAIVCACDVGVATGGADGRGSEQEQRESDCRACGCDTSAPSCPKEPKEAKERVSRPTSTPTTMRYPPPTRASSL